MTKTPQQLDLFDPQQLDLFDPPLACKSARGTIFDGYIDSQLRLLKHKQKPTPENEDDQ